MIYYHILNYRIQYLYYKVEIVLNPSTPNVFYQYIFLLKTDTQFDFRFLLIHFEDFH